MFPSLHFEKQFDAQDALYNNIQGLAILPFPNDIKQITFSKSVIKSKAGKDFPGFGYDLNADKVVDIFLFEELVDQDTLYVRLYLNVEGHWVFRYAHLDETCI